MTTQAAGQGLVIFGFLLWLATFGGLAFYGVVAATRRCWGAVLACKLLSGLFLFTGITLMYQIPGGMR